MNVSNENTEAGNIFSGDHRQRVAVFIDMMKSLNDNTPGPLTRETAKDMIVFSKCITATLHSFLLLEDLKRQTALIMPVGDAGNTEERKI